MKALLILATLVSTQAFAAPIRVVGKFEAKHEIGMMGYDRAACLESHGQWDGDDETGLCTLETEDTVEVSVANGKGLVKVDTITTNAHSCSFEGKAVRLSEKVVVASAPSEIYVPGENGQEGHTVKSQCKLKLVYADSNRVSVSVLSSFESCRDSCGMNASLDVADAIRK